MKPTKCNYVEIRDGKLFINESPVFGAQGIRIRTEMIRDESLQLVNGAVVSVMFPARMVAITSCGHELG